jgi:hypothetical protein
MIRGEENLKSELTAQFDKKYNKNNSLNFYPWSDYSALEADQKLTIIDHQSVFLDTYRSIGYTAYNEFDTTLTVSGNKDTNNESQKRNFEKLVSDDSKEENMELDKNIPLLQYIKNKFKTVDGKPLFHRIYAPSKMTIEVLVHQSVYMQAKKFLT